MYLIVKDFIYRFCHGRARWTAGIERSLNVDFVVMVNAAFVMRKQGYDQVYTKVVV